MQRRGFTLKELLIVLVVVAILVAILFPVFASAREKGRGSTCLSNVGQLAKAALIYAGQNDDRFVRHQWLPIVGVAKVVKGIPMPFGEYLVTEPTFVCPNFRSPTITDHDRRSGGYAINGCVSRQDAPTPDSPSNIVLIGEIAAYEWISPLNGATRQKSLDSIDEPDGNWAKSLDRRGVERLIGPLGKWGSVRHLERGNYAFVDGHARSVAPNAFFVPRGLPCGQVIRAFPGVESHIRFASLPFGQNIHGDSGDH